MRPPKDGRATGVKGTISGDAIRAALGIGATPQTGKVPDSPAQARLRSEGRDREADALAPDDFEVTILDAAEHYAMWGSPELQAPPGAPDGSPVPVAPTAKPRPQRADWSKADPEPATQTPPGPTPNEAAEELRKMAARHTAKAARRAIAAQQSGTPEQKQAAAAEARASASAIRRVRDFLSGA